MTPTSVNPLSEHQIRNIIREHPAAISAAFTGTAPDAHQLAEAATRTLMAHPEIINAIAAAGLGVSLEEAAALGFFRWIVAMNTLQVTATASDPAALLGLLYEELAPLALQQGTIQ